jgi:hypothetical protein
MSAAALQLIAQERAEQLTREGWTSAHDDEHAAGELAQAAAVYAYTAAHQAMGDTGPFSADPTLWPWEPGTYKPKDQLRNLVRAGALIVAEIERLQRAQGGDPAGPR